MIIGPCVIGLDCAIDDSAIIGHPSKRRLSVERDFSKSSGAELGNYCIIRSGSVIYERVFAGDHFQCGHHSIVREDVTIGEDVSIGSGCVIEWGANVGDFCRFQNNVVISETAIIGKGVFIGPNVSLTAGRHMLGAQYVASLVEEHEAVEDEIAYPPIIIEDWVRIGANAVILAHVRLGEECVIAAGAVVTSDVPAGMLAAGNPARLMGAAR